MLFQKTLLTIDVQYPYQIRQNEAILSKSCKMYQFLCAILPFRYSMFTHCCQNRKLRLRFSSRFEKSVYGRIYTTVHCCFLCISDALHLALVPLSIYVWSHIYFYIQITFESTPKQETHKKHRSKHQRKFCSNHLHLRRLFFCN